VALTGEERRRWRELERQLRQDRRLTAHLMRFRIVSGWRRDVATARAGTSVPAITWVPATIMACLGLILVGAGEYVRSGTLVMAAMWVLIVALILAGGALILIGTADIRRDRHRGHRDRSDQRGQSSQQ
jgi:hypothetical protein